MGCRHHHRRRCHRYLVGLVCRQCHVVSNPNFMATNHPPSSRALIFSQRPLVWSGERRPMRSPPPAFQDVVYRCAIQDGQARHPVDRCDACRRSPGRVAADNCCWFSVIGDPHPGSAAAKPPAVFRCSAVDPASRAAVVVFQTAAVARPTA